MESLIFLFTLLNWGNQSGLKVQMKLLQRETPWESGRKFWQIQVLYVWELHCWIYLPFTAVLGNFLRCLNPSHRGEIISLKQFSVGKLFVLLWLKWLGCRPCSVILPLAWSMSSYPSFFFFFLFHSDANYNEHQECTSTWLICSFSFRLNPSSE